MSKYVIYDATTGVIAKTITSDASDISSNVGVGQAALIVTGTETDATHYVSLGPDTVTAKASQAVIWDKTTIIGNGTDAATATLITNPSTVEVLTNDYDGADAIVASTVVDGTVVLNSIVPGFITVVINTGITFLEHRQEITVT